MGAAGFRTCDLSRVNQGVSTVVGSERPANTNKAERAAKSRPDSSGPIRLAQRAWAVWYASDCARISASPGRGALRLSGALASGEPLAQLALQDLAGRGARQRVDELDRPGQL